MNNKGFISISVVFALFTLFLGILISFLNIYEANRIFQIKEKDDIRNFLNDINYNNRNEKYVMLSNNLFIIMKETPTELILSLNDYLYYDNASELDLVLNNWYHDVINYDSGSVLINDSIMIDDKVKPIIMIDNYSFVDGDGSFNNPYIIRGEIWN